MPQQDAPAPQFEGLAEEVHGLIETSGASEDAMREVFERRGIPYIPNFADREDLGTRKFGEIPANKSGSNYIPFFGTGKSVHDLYKVHSAATRLTEGGESPEDRELVTDYLLAESQPRTWGAMVSDVLANGPAFMVEYAATGGALRAAGLLAKESLREAASHMTTAALTKRIGGEIAGRAALNAPRWAESTYQVALRGEAAEDGSQGSQMALGENEVGELEVILGASTDSFLESLPEGLRRQMYEVAGEMSGEVGGALFARALPGAARAMQVMTIRGLAEKMGITVSEAAQQVAGKLGWSGALAEVGEEIFTGALTAAFEDETVEDIIPGYREGQSLKELSAMFAGFAMMGAGVNTLGGVAGRLSPAQAQEADGAESAQPALVETGPDGSKQAEVSPALSEPLAAEAAPEQEVAQDESPAVAPDVQDRVQQFAGEGATVQEPATDAQRRTAEWVSERSGAEVRFVAPADEGAQLPASGASLTEGEILIDSRISDADLLEFTAGHELRHDIDRLFDANPNSGGSAALAERISTLAPDLVAAAGDRYEERRAASPLADIPLAEGELGGEAQADAMGSLVPVLEHLRTPGGRKLAARIVRGDRGAWEAIVDGVVQLVQGSAALDKRKARRLVRNLAKLREATGVEVDQGSVHVARVLNEALDFAKRARAQGPRRAAPVPAESQEAAAQPEEQSAEQPELRQSPTGDLPPKGTPADENRAKRVRRKMALDATGHRPLAEMGETPSERALSGAIVAEMEDRGEPAYLSDPEMRAVAERMARDEPQRVINETMDAALEARPLDETTQEAARIIASQAIQKALGSQQSEENLRWHIQAVRLGNAFRMMRSATARALGMVRDRTPKWARPARELLAESLYTPPTRMRRRLKRLERKLAADRRRAATEARDQRMQRTMREMKELIADDAKALQQAATRLAEMGISPDTVVRDDMEDPAIRRKVAVEVARQRLSLTDWFVAWWMNSILTHPMTHVANVTGNVVNSAVELGLKRGAEAVVAGIGRKLTGRQLERSASFEEFSAMGPALLGAIPEGFHDAMSAWSTSLPGLESRMLKSGMAIESVGSKIEMREATAIPSSKLLGFDWLGFRALEAGDALIKTPAFFTEHAALAMRAAKEEVEEGEDLQTRFGLILMDPQHPIVEEAYAATLGVAFQGPSDRMEQAANTFRDWLNDVSLGAPMGWLMLPFIGTPWKIFKASLRLTPMQVISLANATRHGVFKTDKAPTEEQMVRELSDTLLAMTIFWGIYSMLGSDDDEPMITGSSSKQAGERALQYRTAPPLSIRIGPGEYVTYRRYEPIAMTLATTVDAVDAWKQAAENGDVDQMGALARKVGDSIWSQLGDKTFLRALGDIQRIQEGQKSVPGWLRDTFITPLVPNVIRGFALRDGDEYMREARTRKKEGETALETVVKSMPYALWPDADAEWTPPPRRDAWGQPIERMGDALIPWDLIGRRVGLMRKTKYQPALDADIAMRRWNRAVEAGLITEGKPYFPPAPSYSFVRDGQKHIWDDEEYSELVRIGGEYALEQVSAMDFSSLDEEGEVPPEAMIKSIRDAFTKGRAIARDTMWRKRQQ